MAEGGEGEDEIQFLRTVSAAPASPSSALGRGATPGICPERAPGPGGVRGDAAGCGGLRAAPPGGVSGVGERGAAVPRCAGAARGWWGAGRAPPPPARRYPPLLLRGVPGFRLRSRSSCENRFYILKKKSGLSPRSPLRSKVSANLRSALLAEHGLTPSLVRASLPYACLLQSRARQALEHFFPEFN